jgi:hypothetical protein
MKSIVWLTTPAILVLLLSCAVIDVERQRKLVDLKVLDDDFAQSNCNNADLITTRLTRHCEFTLTRKTITLTFLPRKEFDVLSPSEDGFKTLGVSFVYQDPCHIFIALDDIKIVSEPDVGRARWQNYIDGDNIAHELLHCYTGRWHPNSGPMMEFARRVNSMHALQQYSSDPKYFSSNFQELPYQMFEIEHIPRYYHVTSKR